MLYRLTFALSRDEIITTEFRSFASDIVGATEEAFSFIEENHGAITTVSLVAFSLLKIEESDGKQN
ncbi:hypothetical protein P4V86_03355 [Brevibacillus laterosporus]|uniref:hypothetical protein n=1 Tax=Brevibacillus laterosporus TaxID=1465 RepID=UPI000360D869|nr:hypothetical protein [Brevibacillus laterosporus]ATO48559.1 hypothetical protein BrL25_05185 [Brevibacillus laterosporus DSM 25]MED2002395.1 hypothetical protein [Brevibacillus laterosporus]